ncbi:serine/threonine protein kinase [Rhodoferax sp.]|uniref:serine/threonine protein kinase n=1 Tax=Rhodoferax sp. TaxID=50421 RepID=UPI00274EEF2C|nr:serine/threonine-protein kinase [Rhodoferax sp.]
MSSSGDLSAIPVTQGGDAVSGQRCDDDQATRVLASSRTVLEAISQQPTVARPARSNGPQTPNPTGAGWMTPITATQAVPRDAGPVGPSNASLLPTGTKLAEFEITGLIGQGGFGIVYKAWDHALEREVAIKEYMPSSLAMRQADGSVAPLSERHKETFDAGMRSFINEARLLAQFDDPSLLKVYRFWQEHGTTYMVMPLYKGRTLKSALAHMTAPVEETWLLQVVDRVTHALTIMHQASCYHRDIAPDNILLLEDSGLPVVLDFGAARRVISDMTQAITVILKPGYAPVEQYAEVPDMTQGAWTDVYALAAVMHVAICGRAPPPSVARMLSDQYVALASNEILSKRYSHRLLATIDQALSVRPEHRPQSMAAMREALGLPAITNVTTTPIANPGSASGVGATAVPSTPAAASRRRFQVGAVLAIALVVAGTGWWMSRAVSQGELAVGAPPVIPAPGGKLTPPAGASVAAAPPRSFEVGRALQDLIATGAGPMGVSATPTKDRVKIDQDRLEFSVQSKRPGYVYVLMLSSTGDLLQLFPNQLDKRNQIRAQELLSLPRASWAMKAGGPAGANQFLVVVSERERDFAASGIQYDGVFGQFSLPVLAALEAGRVSGTPSPLLGKALCEAGAACPDVYGVVGFRIVEE